MSRYQIDIGAVSFVLPNIVTTAATLNCPFSIIATSATEIGQRIRNTNGSATSYSIIRLENNAASGLNLFINSTTKADEGGPNAATIRNDIGPLLVAGPGNTNSIQLTGSSMTITSPSLTMSTPLGTASGGTGNFVSLTLLGLATIGTSGQYLSSTGSSLTWVSPSAGTGSVISVSLTVDPSLTSLFTNTGITTVTTSGTFNLALAANPGIVNNSTTLTTFALTNNASTSNNTRMLDMFAPNMGANRGNTLRLGFGTARTGQLRFNNSSAAASTYIQLGCTHELGGVGAVLRLYADGTVASDLLSPLTVSGLVTASAGITTTSLTLSTPLATSSGGTGSTSASTGTGGVVLSTSPTLVTPTLEAASATTLALSGTGFGPLSFSGFNATKILLVQAAPNLHQVDSIGAENGFQRYQVFATTQDHVFFAGVSSTSSNELFRVKGTGGFTSGGNSSITGSMTCTSAAIGAGGFTSVGNSSITGNLSLSNSGTGNLYTFQSVNPNATNSIIGVGNADLSTGNANSGNMIFNYAGPDAPGNDLIVGLSGAGKSALQFINNGTAKFLNCTVEATPRYGTRYKSSNQTVTFSTNSDITWTDIVTGPLTSNGVSYTNSTGADVVVQINYSLLIAGYFGGALAYCWVQVSNGDIRGYTFEIIDTSAGAITNSVIISLLNGQSFKITLFLTQTIDVRGGTFGTSAVSEMSYYILN